MEPSATHPILNPNLDLPHVGQLSLDDKRELLKTLLSLRTSEPGNRVPLSYGQQSLWFVYQLAPQSPAYNFLYAARLRGWLDTRALAAAFTALIQRHPALRTRFVVQDRKPIQQIEDHIALDIPQTDATTWTEEWLHDVLRERADRPFDLLFGPALRIELFRRAPDEAVLLLVFHHIIADLWSMDLLLQELQQMYVAQTRGQDAGLPPLAVQFVDFVRWQLVSVHGAAAQKARAYWQNVLAGELPVLCLPTDRPRPPVQSYHGSSYSWPLAPQVVQRIRSLARDQGATPFVLLLGVFQLLLHRLSGQDDVLVGITAADRARPEWERVVGYFLNQLVLRGDFSADRTFSALLARTREQVFAALEHQDYPFGLLVKLLQPRRDPARSPIFQVMFIWDKPRELGTPMLLSVGSSPGGSLGLEPLLMEQRGAPFDLTLIVFEQGESLTACFRYNSDLFDGSTIERMTGQFNVLLDGLLAAPDRPVSEASLLSPTEQQRLLVEWNGTPLPEPWPRSFAELFEQQATGTPDARALEYGERTVSYREMNRWANQLARHLQQRGVRRGDIVALALPRGIDLIVAILATWKAGAAYLFMDPGFPRLRRVSMADDAKPAILITAKTEPDLPLPTIFLPDDWNAVFSLDDTNLDLRVTPEDWAYVIFTSGSTGQPKGTVLRHRGLCCLVDAQEKVYAVQSWDRVLQFASLNFDASVFEIVLALRAGACLVLADPCALQPGLPLLRFLREKQVTSATLPPSVLAMLPREPLPDLRTLIVAGEACSAELVAAWAPGRRFFNAYGPTEATVWSTVSECHAGGRAPTIGRPIPHTRVYVLDRNFQPVPIGVTGELFLAGPGLAVGYLNRPALTAERFLPNPFESAGAVMYRTGDLVRWTINGELEFLGRCDHQVKLRGYRIELDEIQEVLRSHPGVADAVVIPRGDNSESPTLAAYVVPRDSETFSATDVRAHLRDRLPHYMLPADLVVMPALPLSVNGKVDRSRLPAPANHPPPNRSFTAPRSPKEELLAAIWARVLKLERVGIHDNFFDLGGASIQTLEIVSLACAEGLPLSAEMLFRHQTVAELAAAILPTSSTNGKHPALDAAAVNACQCQVAATHEMKHPATIAAGGALVESIGVYLPEQAVPTADVVRSCRSRLDFPLEQLTGIRNRRVAAATEFSIDLAAKAAAECFRRSAYHPEDIDLLICCNISRCDGPEFRFTLEPTTAAKIRRRFGMVNAVAFDIMNACAGTFTALLLVDSLIRTGTIRRAMVVSGEYITHLTQTAQREIHSFMDRRLACLTLGDSGAALILERSPRPDIGFQVIDLYTLGKYHDLCVAKVTDHPEGGAMMYTDPVKSAAVTIKQAVGHAVEVLRRQKWQPENIGALVMHQTSQTTLDGAVREINRVIGKTVCHRDNTVYNIAERGNTATTTHFLAIAERIQAGHLATGDRVVFAVSGSGQTVGTALYVFDDLPERLRQQASEKEFATDVHTNSCVECPSPPYSGERGWGEGASPCKDPFPSPPTPLPLSTGGEGRSPLENIQHYRLARPVQIESIGTAAGPLDGSADSVALLRHAGEQCLQNSAKPRADIDLVMHTGVYRSEFLSEPAMAAIAAGELGINHDEDYASGHRTLAFDLLNGAAGMLSACFVAGQLIAGGRFSRALLLASEVEHNATAWPENLLGLKPAASALVLEPSEKAGFVSFAFRTFPELVDASGSFTCQHNGRSAVQHRREPDLDSRIMECVPLTVADFLQREGRYLRDIKRVVLPQRSHAFVHELGRCLTLDPNQVIVLDDDIDYFTSSLANTFVALRQTGGLAAGDVILVVEVAAGLQVGCALYLA